MDALDDLADYADEEDALDALAPVIAGVAIRGALKNRVAKIPRPTRRKVVKTVSSVTRHIARKHGPRAIAAVPGILRHARKIVLRKRLPVRALPTVIARTARLAARSPRLLRKFARIGGALRTSTRLRRGVRGVHRLHRHRHGMRGHRAGGLGGKMRRSGMAAGGGVSLRGRAAGAGGVAGYVCASCRRRLRARWA